MKKLLLFLSSVLVCFAAGCAGAAVKKTEINDSTGIIFTVSNDILKTDENTALVDYLTALKERGDITFEGDEGDYGLFITSMDGKANEVISSTASSSEGYSWTVYIDFLTLDGVIYAGDGEICEYEGKALYKATYGVSSIPCLENHTYAFVYEYYNFKW